jgi:NhaP-type Na+/H+ or K+/H+ antiporter
VLALALFAYSSAVLADTNGFVAAFVAGMAFGAACSRAGDDEPLEFSQEAGTLMSLLVWFIFGAVMLVPGLDGATWRDVVFALLALTLVRMVPVAVSLAGAGLDRSTVAFIGWFGPRGLASVVFGLVAVDTLAPAEAKIVLAAVTVTIALSVLLHGVTASPLAVRYGQVAARLQLGRPEHLQAHPITTRSLQRVRKQLKGTAE